MFAFRSRNIRYRIREIFIFVKVHVGRLSGAAGRLYGYVNGALAGGERFDGEIGRSSDHRTDRFDARAISTNSAM